MRQGAKGAGTTPIGHGLPNRRGVCSGARKTQATAFTFCREATEPAVHSALTPASSTKVPTILWSVVP
jgi:hypothetical protein